MYLFLTIYLIVNMSVIAFCLSYDFGKRARKKNAIESTKYVINVFKAKGINTDRLELRLKTLEEK